MADRRTLLIEYGAMPPRMLQRAHISFRSPPATAPGGRLRVAILGSGNIGTDLLMKVRRSRALECVAMIGRKPDSPGLARARELGLAASPDGIAYLTDHPECCDLVFDATSAEAHALHLPILKNLGKISIDLTPAGLGRMCVPAVNGDSCLEDRSVNLVTCGGQAAIPIACAIALSQPEVRELEVVSSLASRSAGPATRVNIEEYLLTTEKALGFFTGIRQCKAMLNLNPALPCMDMQTTILASVANPDVNSLNSRLWPIVAEVRRYVPGYEVIVGPMIENDRLVITLRVKGLGDFLPEYAGNLDIICCAAVATAERYARQAALTGCARQFIGDERAAHHC